MNRKRLGLLFLRRLILWLSLLMPSLPPVAHAEDPFIDSSRSPESVRLDWLLRRSEARTFGPGSVVDLAEQATVRLTDLMFLLTDYDLSHEILTKLQRPVPPELLGLLFGVDGFNMMGPVEFVRDGAADPDVLRAMTPEDLLAGLKDTLQKQNKANPDARPMEARRWVVPPRYNADRHQLVYAALIVPQSSPEGSGGPVDYIGILFGRDGYLKVTIASTTERAGIADSLVTRFLSDVQLRPGKGLDSATAVPRAKDLAARAMRIETPLRHAPTFTVQAFNDHWVLILGGGIAVIAGSTLAVGAYRQRRRETRRW